jgi:hypothetical protein
MCGRSTMARLLVCSSREESSLRLGDSTLRDTRSSPPSLPFLASPHGTPGVFRRHPPADEHPPLPTPPDPLLVSAIRALALPSLPQAFHPGPPQRAWNVWIRSVPAGSSIASCALPLTLSADGGVQIQIPVLLVRLPPEGTPCSGHSAPIPWCTFCPLALSRYKRLHR